MVTSQDDVITLETSQEVNTSEGEIHEGQQEGDWDHLGDLAHSNNILFSDSILVHAIDQPEATPPVCGPWNLHSLHTLSQEQEIDDQEAMSPESSQETESQVFPQPRDLHSRWRFPW